MYLFKRIYSLLFNFKLRFSLKYFLKLYILQLFFGKKMLKQKTLTFLNFFAVQLPLFLASVSCKSPSQLVAYVGLRQKNKNQTKQMTSFNVTQRRCWWWSQFGSVGRRFLSETGTGSFDFCSLAWATNFRLLMLNNWQQRPTQQTQSQSQSQTENRKQMNSTAPPPPSAAADSENTTASAAEKKKINK